jgi:protocatechuate 3,4-dioxygenase beta subunit
MVSSTRQALACIFAIFSVALAVHAQTTPVKEPGATITGNVTVQGKAAAGVIVVMLKNDRRTSGREYSGPKDVTDAEGNYRIENVPAGNYRIMPAARAYVSTDEANRERNLVVNKGDTIEHIDFALVPGGVITGKVVDAEGKPMVEEFVQVFTVTENQSVYGGYTSTSTDDRGVYRMYGLRPGSYRVAAGRGEESFHSGAVRPYRRTYHPSVSDPLQATVIEVVEGGETKDIDITFTRRVTTYSVSGRIVDETGQPIPNVDYGITRYDGQNTSTMSGGYTTNSRGEFKLSGLAPGKYSLPVSRSPDSDLRFEEAQFEVVDQDVTNLVIKATRGASISGVVIFEGLEDKKASEVLGRRAWVMASLAEATTRSANSSTPIKEDGSFTIRGLAAGTANLHIHASGSLRVERVERDGVIQSGSSLVIREREQIKGIRVIVQIGNATIRGKIEVTNGTLPPDARFHIWARRTDGAPNVINNVNNIPQIDTRGQFVIENLNSGTYELNAGVFIPSKKEGYVAKKEQVVVAAGSTTTVNVTVDLSSTPIKQ